MIYPISFLELGSLSNAHYFLSKRTIVTYACNVESWGLVNFMHPKYCFRHVCVEVSSILNSVAHSC